jgi:hypothetical protein
VTRVYGLAVLDRYGRLAELTVLRALGWGPGQPLTLTLLAGSVLAAPCSGSPVRVGNDGYLRLPVGLRRACRLVAGDRVLLVAEPPAGRLLLHPPAALDALLDAHHTALLRGSDAMTTAQPHQATANTATPSTARQAELDAARLLLDRMGITPADLLGAARSRAEVPTFAQYVPRVRQAVGDGTRRVYGSYWNRILERWADRRLDEITATDIKQLVEHTRTTTLVRRNHRGGRGAAEHLIAALSCLYRHAEDDDLIDPATDPARKVAKPRRLPSTRRAVPDDRLAEIHHAAATTGDDPALDTLLLRLHVETACRRGGALALRPNDLDPTSA